MWSLNYLALLSAEFDKRLGRLTVAQQRISKACSKKSSDCML
jgi:hypothetical protein